MGSHSIPTGLDSVARMFLPMWRSSNAVRHVGTTPKLLPRMARQAVHALVVNIFFVMPLRIPSLRD
jgi:hypothetical protein